MRFSRIKLNSMGPFTGPVDVDLDALPGTLAAVTGPNGAGKSTLLELLAGAIYRRTPTRGSLADLATARDSSVEVEVLTGARYCVTQLVDHVSGKGETVITNGDGRAVLDSSKVRAGDEWIRSHLLPEEVVLSTIFAAQQSGGFLDMKPGDRKSVLLRILQIEHLEAMAARARERAREAAARLATADARLADERARGGDVAALEAELELARTAARAADAIAERVSLDLRTAEAAAADAGEALRTWQRRSGEAAALRQRAGELAARVADLERRIENNRAVQAQAAEIRSAVSEDERLAEEERQYGAEVERLLAEERRLADALRVEQQAAARATAAVRDAEERAARAQARLADREAIAAAAADLPRLREALAAVQADLARAEAVLERARGQRIAGAEQRIEGLRRGLAAIANDEQHEIRDLADAVICASRTLDADDDAVEAARQVPEVVRQLEAAVLEVRARAIAANNAVSVATQTAARAGEMDQAAAEAEAAAQASAAAERDREAAQAAACVLERERGEATETRTATGAQLAVARDRRAAIAPLVKLAGPLAQAEARLAELEPQLAEVAAERTSALEQLAAYADLGTAPAAPDLDAARRRSDESARKAREAHQAEAQLEQRVGDARASAERVAALEAERAAVAVEHADWTRLGADLGRTGLQALEIDAAGPELTELVNDLLRSAFGPRFTVSIETTRTGSDGRELEGCEVRVLDTERGREGAAETFSGGERVVIGEAVALALSTLACRRAGIERPTIVRDESGAALDPVNGRAYVGMLRRAAALIGADRVLYVSHTPELQELADARLVIEDGRVRIEA